MEYLAILSFLVSSILTGYVFSLTAFRFSTFEIFDYGITGVELTFAAMLAIIHYWFLVELKLQFLIVVALHAVQFYLSSRCYYQYVVGNVFSTRNFDLSKKVYIVTGANTGIGYETTKALLKMNATVIMACRSAERANQAKNDLLKELPQVSPSKIIFVPLDLSDFQSVRKFVDEFKKLSLPLDGLVNNAGLMNDQRMTAKNGMEMNFMANHLSHFLLTNLLLPQLEVTKGRVVTLASSVHNLATTIHFDDLMFTKNYEMFACYGHSKLSNILFAKELQTRLNAKGSNVTSYSVHPGCVRTEVTRNMHPVMQIGNYLATPIMVFLQKTPEEGAYSTLHVLLNEHTASVKGGYFVHGRMAPSSKASNDKQLAKRLWEVSEQLTA